MVSCLEEVSYYRERGCSNSALKYQLNEPTARYGLRPFDYLLFASHIAGSLWTKMLNWMGFTRPMGSTHTELDWANSWASKKTGIGRTTNFAMVSTLFGRK